MRSYARPRREFLEQTLFKAGVIAGFSPLFGRADESSQIVDRDLAAAMGKAELSLQFQGHSANDCRDWQKTFRAKLDELMGDSTPPPKWTLVEENRTEFDEYTRLELLLTADGVPSLPVYLLIPKGLPDGHRAPAVLCVHGHGPFGNDAIVGRREQEGAAEHIDKLNYDYGVQFVKRGYVVAAPCMIPFGRRVNSEAYRGKDPCAVTFLRMQALGQLPITANVRDLRWSIDLLQSRPEVNDDAIGCAGLSYGGRMTMMVSAIDKRVRVAAVSGALNLLQERMTARHSCGSQIVPGLLKYGDYSEIGSLIAPRPCVWETGSKDSLIVPKWDDVFRERLRRVYKALNAGDNLHFDRFKGGHEWSGKIAFPLFDVVLEPYSVLR
ncbi:MAG: alpha/beta hydrolase family protein [Fuerstiella sp.]|nr:alpha/beta hydrolase family protein [Fuerstiella sp.]